VILPLGGTSPTFGGDITDQNKMCIKFLWGGHHRPLGGDITDLWGGHHRPLGGTSPTKTPFNAPENLVFFAPKLILNLF
jgi:hypothetical protein